MGSNPSQPVSTVIDFSNDSSNKTKLSINTKDFERFLRLEKCLSERTISDYISNVEAYLKSGLSIKDFLLGIKQTRSQQTYKNYLAALKILFRDYLNQPEIIKDFKFPRLAVKPKVLPSKAHLKIFYDALTDKYKVVFLMLASSGLRVSELLNAQIDKTDRMIIPNHNSQTKNSWVSFYNEETAALLDAGFPKITVDGLNHVFKKTAVKTGINIYPHLLRAIFAREMNLRGVQDRYIDAFCGRVPQSVLAKHYSDFSPEVLKEIYDKANLRYFN